MIRLLSEVWIFDDRFASGLCIEVDHRVGTGTDQRSREEVSFLQISAFENRGLFTHFANDHGITALSM